MHYEYERLDKRGSRSDFNGRIPCKKKENQRIVTDITVNLYDNYDYD